MPTALAKPWPSGPVVVSIPRCTFALRMARGLGAELAEILDFVHRQGITRQMQQRVQQHRGMAVRQHEAVAVPPGRIAGINFSTSRHSTSAMSAMPMGAPGWPGFGLLDGVHRKARIAFARSSAGGHDGFFFTVMGDRPRIVPDAHARQQGRRRRCLRRCKDAAARARRQSANVGRSLPTDRVSHEPTRLSYV